MRYIAIYIAISQYAFGHIVAPLSCIFAVVNIFAHKYFRWLIISATLLSCQPRLTVASCFVYKVIMDLSSIDLLCINPIRGIGLIHK